MWGTSGRKEAASARQALGARMKNRMMGRSQRAQSGHKTCGSDGLMYFLIRDFGRFLVTEGATRRRQ